MVGLDFLNLRVYQHAAGSRCFSFLASRRFISNLLKESAAPVALDSCFLHGLSQRCGDFSENYSKNSWIPKFNSSSRFFSTCIQTTSKFFLL